VEQSELVAYATELLDRINVTYMLVGSMASMAYGESRFTLDVDIVVDLNLRTVVLLCQGFPDPDFYVSLPAAEEALKRRSQFNVIQPKTGLKIDFMVARQDEWGHKQLARRRRVQIFPDQWGYTAAPEDVILGKLLYFKEGQSEKHLRDIAAMLEISGDLIDRDDVSVWATKLGVNDVWQGILKRLNGKCM
jgi:hypothetical protein